MLIIVVLRNSHFFTWEVGFDDFPDKNWELWHRIKSNVQIKYQCREVENFPLSIKILIQKLSSEKFLKDLEKLTGIKKLVPDPYFFGGGIHMIPRGGRLEVHSDFSEATHLKIFRRWEQKKGARSPVKRTSAKIFLKFA